MIINTSSTKTDLRVFLKVPKNGVMKTQVVLFCPFCNAEYIHGLEVRESVTCPACNGQALLAAIATEEVEAVFDSLKNYTDEEIEALIRQLGAGHYRSEYKTYLRNRVERSKISETLPNKQIVPNRRY